MLKKLFIIFFVIALSSCATQGINSSNDAAPTSAQSQTYQIGMRYLLGRAGTEQNFEEARRYFEKSSRQGNAYAENELGYLYLSGKGVDRNYATALYWFDRAAQKGLASAEYNAGQMYSHGMGTAVNKIKAKALFQRASDHGFAPAKRALEGARS
jgi:TPR repeat protein